MSRLSVEITPQQHRQIKALAVLQGKSIKDYILEKLFTLEEEEQVAWNELENLLTKRIKSAESEPLSSKTIQEIADEVVSE
ncbi:hypothetical protein [Jiulongibacter sp. NS-SX5]|uniref:hypothetical protein n=1 Tax=Jiulongibacter sp. NS-SX5 TaxID=3463854 RepID=UPI004059CC8F